MAQKLIAIKEASLCRSARPFMDFNTSVTWSLCMMSLAVWLPGPHVASRWSLSRGVFVQGISVLGSLFWGVSVWRVSVWGGSLSGKHPRTVKRGRFASYWNAFLFVVVVVYFIVTENLTPNDVENMFLTLVLPLKLL